jgi:hypothetical protein
LAQASGTAFVLEFPLMTHDFEEGEA